MLSGGSAYRGKGVQIGESSAMRKISASWQARVAWCSDHGGREVNEKEARLTCRLRTGRKARGAVCIGEHLNGIPSQ